MPPNETQTDILEKQPAPKMKTHLEILNRELQSRVARNGRYSLRAYAKFLGLHSSALSRVMSGKLELTSENGVKIAKKLKLTTDESRRFVRSILKAREHAEVTKLGDMLETPALRPVSKKIESHLYADIASVDALAILQLAHTKNFVSDAGWISRVLNRPAEDIRNTVTKLCEIGLLERDHEGRFQNTHAHMTAVENDETNEVRRQAQAEILDRSQRSLMNDPLEKRAHYGMTMAVDPSKIEVARERIFKFIEELSDELECDDQREVYQLAVSLYPLTDTSRG